MPRPEYAPDWVTPCRESLPSYQKNLLDLLDIIPWQPLLVLTVIGAITALLGTGFLSYWLTRKGSDYVTQYQRKPRKRTIPSPLPAPAGTTEIPHIPPVPPPVVTPEVKPLPDISPRRQYDPYPVPSRVLAFYNNSPPMIAPAPPPPRRRGRSTTPRQRDHTPRTKQS